MKSTPMLMKPEMIRAYMAGRKTQTRWVIKSQPDEDGICFDRGIQQWTDTSGTIYKCPYGQPGDELWFRETWFYDGDADITYFRATDKIIPPKWKQSNHMPRWACRHTAKIIDIWVEWVQDISEVDARAEGAGFVVSDCSQTYREDFKELWDSINGKKPGRAWADNPLTWVIEFKRHI